VPRPLDIIFWTLLTAGGVALVILSNGMFRQMVAAVKARNLQVDDRYWPWTYRRLVKIYEDVTGDKRLSLRMDVAGVAGVLVFLASALNFRALFH
jgi:predicted component of viral defense system (DUF524 family)